MERILGLDIGKQKIGIAMSDLLGMTAQPKATIRSKNLEEQIQKILDLIKEFNKRGSCRSAKRHQRWGWGTGAMD